MKPRKNKLSLLRKARQSAGRTRCNNCPFLNENCIGKGIFDICFNSYVKGYMKGYKTCNKEIKDNYFKVLNSIK